MKKALIFFLILSGFKATLAQSGCTDPQASNYSSTATINDGSCIYPVSHQPFQLKVNTPLIGSNSGIEWINGSIYSFEDSGNSPSLYKVDTITGGVQQTIYVTNFPNIDWEDITADSAYVYIGDFGNNNGNRSDLRILKVAKSAFVNNPAALVSVTAQAISFKYADQTSLASNSSTNFDCEAMLNVNDSLYIFSKDRGDLKTRVYKLPKTPGNYTVSPFTNYDVKGKITGADYNPINNEVVLIGYMGGNLSSFLWYLSDFRSVSFFSGNKRRVELGNSNYAWQTEGVCFYNETSTSRIFISCEVNGVPAGIYVSDVSRISDGIKTNSQLKTGLNYLPDNSINVTCSSEIRSVTVYDALGRETADVIRYIAPDKINIHKTDDQPGSFGILKIETVSGDVYVNKIIN